MRQLGHNYKVISIGIVFLSVLNGLGSVKGFTVGPPPLPTVCRTMNPQHHDYKPQGSEPPYLLSIDNNEVQAGSSVIVTLTNLEPKETQLIGFYVQARDENDAPIGVWLPNKDTKVHSCGGVRNNAAHHANGKIKKENVTIVWTAPSKYKGEIVFSATAMRDFVTYWVFLQSEPLQVINNALESTLPPFTTLRPILNPFINIRNRTRNFGNSVRNLVQSVTSILTIRPGQNRVNFANNANPADSNQQPSNVVKLANSNSNNESLRNGCNDERVFNLWFCNLFRMNNN